MKVKGLCGILSVGRERLTEAKRRLRAYGLPRGVALRGPLRCAPRCHARALFRWPGCLPVGDCSSVGVLGVERHGAFGVAGGGVAGAVAGADLALA